MPVADTAFPNSPQPPGKQEKDHTERHRQKEVDIGSCKNSEFKDPLGHLGSGLWDTARR